MRPRSLWILGEDALALAGLERLLAAEEGLRVQRTIVLPADVEELAPEPDVGIWDLGVRDPPDADPLWLPERFPAIALVAGAATARAAMAAGARGALLRDAGVERLVAAIDAVVEGLIVLEEEIAQKLLRPAPTALPFREELTPREREVLELLALGLSNRDISTRLGISPHTAKFHVNSLLGKLGAATRTEAVALAARSGLVTF